MIAAALRAAGRAAGLPPRERLLGRNASGARAPGAGRGARGSLHASLLVRAGVGTVRIIDRDFVEESNLQRQVLFDEEDARALLPKAIAAERKLRAVNSLVQVEGLVEDLSAGTI